MATRSQERIRKLRLIHEDIEKNEPRDKEKVIAEIKIEFGNREEKAKEYIEDLKKADKIKETDDGKLLSKTE